MLAICLFAPELRSRLFHVLLCTEECQALEGPPKTTFPSLLLLADFLSDSVSGKYRWETEWLEMGWLEEM